MDKHGYNVFYLCIAAAMYALKQAKNRKCKYRNRTTSK